jgi:hypothetical protein
MRCPILNLDPVFDLRIPSRARPIGRINLRINLRINRATTELGWGLLSIAIVCPRQ